MTLTSAELDRWLYSVQRVARSPIGLREVLRDLEKEAGRIAIATFRKFLREMILRRCDYCRYVDSTWPLDPEKVKIDEWRHRAAGGSGEWRECGAAWERSQLGAIAEEVVRVD